MAMTLVRQMQGATQVHVYTCKDQCAYATCLVGVSHLHGFLRMLIVNKMKS